MADPSPYLFATGAKIYSVCAGCGEIVRMNKPIFGSIHVCATEQEQVAHRQGIRASVQRNLAALRSGRGFR
jgi:hypothetical protein